MKKLFTLIIFFVATSIFFTSCNQTVGISLTKRHYRSGYNLEVSGKPSKVKTAELETMENTSPEELEYASIQSSGENYIKPKPMSFIDNSSENTIKADNEANVVNNNGTGHLNKTTSKPLSKIISSVKRIAKTPFLLKHVISENEISFGKDDDTRDKGGLIWTIIAVLLVLWLLSLLTGGWGLGGLLYLFLVVALVLILLRLLGVI
ncbi:MAG: DUF5670 family protein [Bacteroidota bacterium]